MSGLHRMSAGEFVRRLRSSVDQPDRHYVFWLGAGCSVTSEIPAAAELVRKRWLPQLQRVKGGDGDVGAWTAGRFPGYDEANAGVLYGTVMNELFPFPEERQRETEELCDGRVPGFGYGVLAALMSRDDGFFSAALTTNFDDLIADAMYVFGERRPLVIQHDSLASFVRPGRVRRPLVVKVHGDHRLNPIHTAEETEELKASVADGIRGLLHDRGLIFVGYSGNDHGVIETFQQLQHGSLPLGVWWVSSEEPQSAIREWLESREAVWVHADGFDELMLLFRDEFEIEHPTADKFERMIKGYRSAYERLSARVDELSDSAPDAEALKGAARRATDDAPDWWGIELIARRYKDTDPDRADEIYRDGIARVPDARLIGNYALFVDETRHDHDRAQELYEQALDRDPNHPNLLGNYALFLERHRQDYDRAWELYERAIAADPTYANALGNYAVFLETRRDDYDRAEAHYERALAADPYDAGILGNYAVFLESHRQDYDRAQELYERAIAADPAEAKTLGNYAELLESRRQDYDRAQQLYELALAADPTEPDALGNYAKFLENHRQDYDRAEELYERAIAADPDRRGTVGDYAVFLQERRKDYDRAQALYERAIADKPDDPDYLGEYALFCEQRRQDYEGAAQLYERALAADADHANNLGNYARLLFAQGDDARALTHADRVLAQADLDPELHAEVLMYLTAVGPQERRATSLTELAELVRAGARSPDWDFSRILERARDDGDPRIEFLQTLADVISERKDVSELERFEEWPAA